MRPTKPYGTKFDRRRPFIEQVGLVYVRGCEIQGMLDDKGRVIEDGTVTHPCVRMTRFCAGVLGKTELFYVVNTDSHM